MLIKIQGIGILTFHMRGMYYVGLYCVSSAENETIMLLNVGVLLKTSEVWMLERKEKCKTRLDTEKLSTSITLALLTVFLLSAKLDGGVPWGCCFSMLSTWDLDPLAPCRELMSKLLYSSEHSCPRELVCLCGAPDCRAHAHNRLHWRHHDGPMES